MDFRLDMYTLLDVFLNHAVCTRRSSASSFWEVAIWIWQPGWFSCSSSSGMGCSVSSLSRSNETIFAGGVDGGFNSSSSDSSELHSVTAKIGVPQKRAALVGKWVVMAWEHQLDRLQ